VLKLGVPNPELSSEINALKFYAGRGACRLLEAEPDLGMLLLERLRPGGVLLDVREDDRATEIAAVLMKQIQLPVSDTQGFLSLRQWFDGLKGLRPRFGGGSGPFPEKTLSRVEGMIRELFEEGRPQVLLHGDFHHYNILSSERGWLVIDPKGVVGSDEYEVGPYLVNPMASLPDEAHAIQRTQRRISIFCEHLGFEPERVLRWATCFSLLSSWWDVDENGRGGEISRAWTEIFLKTRT